MEEHLGQSPSRPARSVNLVSASAERLAIGETLGADSIVNIRYKSPSEALARHGAVEAPSVIIEATGNPASITEAVNACAPGGRIILQGIFAGQKLNNLDLDRIVIGEVTLTGVLGSPGVWPDVIRLVESGRVNLGALVTHSLELDKYHSAIDQVKHRSGIKTIVRADTGH
jgi:threonine dehydrogenase-like Zn-dependent dehydrogenase